MASEKFTALVHYIIQECTDRPSELGAVRLNKVLWFSDVIAYKLHGRGITGESYVKRQYGPVPKHILQTLEELEREDKILVLEPEYRFDTRKFIARTAPASQTLSDEERAIAGAVLDDVLGRTANAVSEMSHDAIWQAAEEGEEIPLFATLAGHDGEITEEVIEWAARSCAQRVTA